MEESVLRKQILTTKPWRKNSIRRNDFLERHAQTPETMCICNGLSKNLPMPKITITTNEKYYKRQLKFCGFNIHELPTKRAFFYTYDETISKRFCRSHYMCILVRLPDD